MAVTIYDALGIQDVTARNELTPLKVAGRDAIRGVSPGGVCVIAIKTGEKSRVDASVSMVSGPTSNACDLVGSWAETVAKKLP